MLAANPSAPVLDDDIDLVVFLVAEVRERAPVSGPALELAELAVNEALQLRPERCPVPDQGVGRELPTLGSVHNKR